MKRIIPLILVALATLAFSMNIFGDQRVKRLGVYVMDNNPNGNSLVYFNRRTHGRLAAPRFFYGGGQGAGDNAKVDPLGSQNSLLMDRKKNVIYMVNAGSDNISVYLLSRRGVPRLAQTIYSGGDFPVSLASDGKLLYVLNSGSDGAINGYTINQVGLLTQHPNSLRILGTGQDGPPVGDARNLAPGDISFDTLARRLIITFGAGTELEEGKLFSFLLDDDGLPSESPNTTVSQGRLPFSLAHTRHGIALVADALGPDAGKPGSGIGGGLSSYSYSETNLLSPIDTVANGTIETCWIRTSHIGDTVYTTSTGSGAIGSYSVSRTGKITLLNNRLTADLESPTDFALTKNDRFMYVIESAAGRVRAFRILADGSLRDLGATRGLPTFEADGYAPQGLVVR